MTLQRRTIAAAAAVGLSAALAWAAIPDGSGVIHGCYKKESGSLRVVDEGAACNPSELAVAWNQQGPAGQPGAEGPRGPSDAWHTPGDNVALPDAEWYDAARLTLPPGSYVLTGGGSVGNINGNNWYAFCALRSADGELTRMRVDMQEGSFNSTPFVLTAAVSLTETSDVTLACQAGTSPDGSVPNPAYLSGNALTAIQVATLH